MNAYAYIVRRAFRILPIFLLGVLAGVVAFKTAAAVSAQKAIALSGTTTLDANCIAAKLTVLASLVPAFHPCSYAGNAPLLTVMVEIALYVCFVPLVTRRNLLMAVLACCVLASIAVAAFPRYQPLYNWWQNSSLYAFLPIWWIGAFSANTKFADRLWSGRYALGGLWLVLTAAVYFDPTAISSELRKLVLGALFGILIAQIGSMKLQIKIPAMPYLGSSAYSLYATHAPVILIAGWPWWLAILLSIVLAMIVFKLIEHPLDRLGHIVAKGDSVT